MTTLHAGGKFDKDTYTVSGGLHGVGVSVVNALAESLHLEIWREGATWTQEYSRGKPTSELTKVGKDREDRNQGPVHARRGNFRKQRASASIPCRAGCANWRS